MKIQVFWDITSCWRVKDRRFGGSVLGPSWDLVSLLLNCEPFAPGPPPSHYRISSSAVPGLMLRIVQCTFTALHTSSWSEAWYNSTKIFFFSVSRLHIDALIDAKNDLEFGEVRNTYLEKCVTLIWIWSRRMGRSTSENADMKLVGCWTRILFVETLWPGHVAEGTFTRVVANCDSYGFP